MSPPRLEFSRRAIRWFLSAALLALAPKCLLCVAPYAGLGVALGLGGPELCGASADSPGAWASSLAWLGLASGFSAIGMHVAICRLKPRANGGLETPRICNSRAATTVIFPS
jgi:hypothetical protein